MQATRMDKRRAHLKKREEGRRFRLLGIIFGLLLMLLIFRLYFIQVINGEEYVNRVRQQQTDRILLEKIRGNITDRNGISFTSAGQTWMLKVIPYAIGFDTSAYEIIESLTGMSESDFTSEPSRIHSVPVVNPDAALLDALEANIYPGVLCYREKLRYDDNSIARHVIGYIRKSDGIPMSGIEKACQEWLHPGTSSYVSVFADAANRPLFSLGCRINEPEGEWYNVRLTLDHNIQSVLEEVLDRFPGRRHGGVVVDAATGEILALASRPQYQQHDPAAAQTDGMNSSFLAIPLEQYPLGSVFKIVVAAAALESGRYDEGSTFTCTGGIQAGGRWIPCHFYSGGLGEITLREAFAHSCNDTFIRIAQEIGGDAIVETARKFGLGSAADIGLANASGRLMEKNEYTGAGIANLAIGQGSTLVTPLQAADMITTILNGGKRTRLKLIDGLVDPEGRYIKYDPGAAGSNTTGSNTADAGNANGWSSIRVLSPGTASALAQWMGDVTAYGTGVSKGDTLMEGTAGKTGTPQVSGDPKSSNYGWFAGYFPRENPKYVIVILTLEEGGAANMALPVFNETVRGIRSKTGN